jgi:hypothetical protein
LRWSVVQVGWGFQGVLVGSRFFFLPPGCSFWLPDIHGTEVDDAWEDFCRGSFTMRLSLAAKPSHVVVGGGGSLWIG